MSTKSIITNICNVKENLSVYGNTDLVDVNIKGVLSINNLLFNSPTENGFVLTSTQQGHGEWKKLPSFTLWELTNNDDIFYNKGFVGIGTENPEKKLHVTDNIKIEGSIETSDILFTEKHSTIFKNDYLFIKTPVKNEIGSELCDKTIFVIDSNNNIGINQEYPTESLDVYGNVKLSGNIIHKSNTFLFPYESDTLVGEDQPQTLRLKTLISSDIISPKISNPIITGDITLNGSTITGVKQPIDKNDIVNKEYVDMISLTGSLIFLDSVNNFVIDIPKKPEMNERFIISEKSVENLETKKGQIITWNGLEWIFEIPKQNNIVLVKHLHSQYIYLENKNKWVVYTSLINHSDLQNLYVDDHLQYFNIHGRKGGQKISGGLKASDSLIIESTTHMIKGPILLNPLSGNVGIFNRNPIEKLDVIGNIKLSGELIDSENKKYKLPNHNKNSTELISTDSINTLHNKTLVNPIIDGILNNFRYNVTSVKSSRMLNEKDYVLLITSTVTLTLPESNKNSGRTYIFIINKNNVKCTINLLGDDRMNVNSKSIVLSEIHKPKTILADGLFRWYIL